MPEAGFNVDYRIPLDEGKLNYDLHSSVVSSLHQRGLVTPAMPTINTSAGPQYYRGELPPNLTSHSDDQLGDLLNQLSRWQDFIQTDLASSHLAYSQAQVQLAHVEAQLRLTYKYDENSKKRTEQERNDLMMVDKRYVEIRRNVLYTEGVYRFTRAIAESADKNWDTVSRRISQRQKETDRGGRENGVGAFNGGPMLRRP